MRKRIRQRLENMPYLLPNGPYDKPGEQYGDDDQDEIAKPDPRALGLIVLVFHGWLMMAQGEGKTCDDQIGDAAFHPRHYVRPNQREQDGRGRAW